MIEREARAHFTGQLSLKPVSAGLPLPSGIQAASRAVKRREAGEDACYGDGRILTTSRLHFARCRQTPEHSLRVVLIFVLERR